MSAELSQATTDLQKIGASVVHSGKIYHRRAADVLAERFAPLIPEGQPKPDFAGLQLAMVSLVEAELVNLLAFDESHVEELDDDRDQRVERDVAYAELFDTLTGIQKACEGVYGEAASVRLLGGVEDLPRDPVKLHRLGLRVASRLANPEYEITGARLPGWQMRDRKKLSTAVGRSVDRLGRALDGLGGESKSSALTLLEKQQAIEDAGRSIRFAATCLASLFSLAGFDALAAKVRPKRRASRRKADTTGEGEAQPAADSAAAADSASAVDGDGAAETPSGPTLVVS